MLFNGVCGFIKGEERLYRRKLMAGFDVFSTAASNIKYFNCLANVPSYFSKFYFPLQDNPYYRQTYRSRSKDGPSDRQTVQSRRIKIVRMTDSQKEDIKTV